MAKREQDDRALIAWLRRECDGRTPSPINVEAADAIERLLGEAAAWDATYRAAREDRRNEVERVARGLAAHLYAPKAWDDLTQAVRDGLTFAASSAVETAIQIVQAEIPTVADGAGAMRRVTQGDVVRWIAINKSLNVLLSNIRASLAELAPTLEAASA